MTLVVKNPPANAGGIREEGSIPGWGRSPRGGHGNPSSILAWRIHGQRSLVGYSPQGCKESDMTQRLNNNKHKNNTPGDFPGGPVVKNLLSNAGDMGLIPGWELTSHMAWGN